LRVNPSSMAKLFTFFLILINVALAVSGQLSIKTGMNQVGYITAKNIILMMSAAIKNPYVLFGLLAYTLAAGTWIVVLSRVDVSFAYPMLSLGYIAILIISGMFLHESVTLLRIFGTALIVTGILFIFRS